jgi:hypothetical protein
MSKATKQCWIGRFAWAMVVILAVALVLVLSIATTLGVAHGLDHTTLALPIFFLFLFLPTSVGDWLDVEDCIFTSKPRFSPSLSRGPPA